MQKFFDKFPAKVFLQSSGDPEKDLQDFENQFNSKIPQRLRDILVEGAGAIVFDKKVSFKPLESTGWEGPLGTIALSTIFGPYNNDFGLLSNKLTYADRLSNSVTPFAELGGGNLLCYEEQTGRILFWDHEAPPGERNLFLVAENFSEFEATLKVEDDQPPSGNLGVVKVELKF